MEILGCTHKAVSLSVCACVRACVPACVRALASSNPTDFTGVLLITRGCCNFFTLSLSACVRALMHACNGRGGEKRLIVCVHLLCINADSAGQSESSRVFQSGRFL